MVDMVVDEDSMATLFVMDPVYERSPEVFRGQPQLHLILEFSRYVNFVENYLNKVNLLGTSTLELRAIIELYNHEKSYELEVKFFSAFLLDVAYAVCKEVYFAERLGKGATRITHSITNGVVFTDADVNDYYDLVAAHIRPTLCGQLSRFGFPLNEVSEKNMSSFKYAVVTYYFSQAGSFTWFYKI